MKKLAIYDYGIGGIDLYKRIKRDKPDLGITYFSDSGEVPYGKLDQKTLQNRVKSVIEFLKNDGCSLVVIACHSASTSIQDLGDNSVIDMIGFTKNCLPKSNGQKLGIIGGGRTVDSNIYRDHYASIGYEVIQNNAQILSVLIESGLQDEEEYIRQINSIIDPINRPNLLLLACTHYPVLMKQFHKALQTDCKIVDPMDFMYDSLKDKISECDSTEDRFYTTGNIDTMAKALKAVYGLMDKHLIAVTV